MKKISTRQLAMTGILSALAAILMFIELPLAFFIPNFVKLDFSELPALVAAFAYGPLSGVFVCLIKNLLHIATSNSGSVGELCNFIIGVFFVIPAGIIYKRHKCRKSALIGSLTGAVCMAAVSFPVNYFIIYPFYTTLMPMDTIISAYNAIWSNINSLWQALLFINVPFTLFKGMCDVVFAMLIYKHISPFLHGRKRSI